MAKMSEKLVLEKGGPAGAQTCGEIVTLDLSSMQIKASTSSDFFGFVFYFLLFLFHLFALPL